ncbi:putative AC transposase, partial [Pseudolycoriella hygida]
MNKRKKSTVTTTSSKLAKNIGDPNNDLKLSECEILFVNQLKDSFVWMFFGDLVLKSNVSNGAKSNPFADKYVCNRCFQIELERSPTSKLLKDCSIKSYAKSVSTGNLASHLQSHGITQHKPLNETMRTLDTFFNTNRRVGGTATKKKFALIRDLVLLCCKDLFPFNLVSGEGLTDFVMKYNIIVSPEDMPCRVSIARSLNEIYEDCKSYVKERIKTDCPDHASLTFDLWSDKHRRRSYITFTLHFIDNRFRMINLTLATIHFPERHTGINIHAEIEKILFEFGLDKKKLYMVTDAGSNCRLACKLGNFENLLCVGHGLHNLITKDGFKKTPTIFNLVTKVKNIVKALRYRTSLFEKLSKDQEALAKEMTRLSEELLVFVEEEEVDESSSSESSKTLKLDVKTRWHSQLIMIESFICQNRNVINVMLQSIEKGDLILSQTDYALLQELCQFLQHFEKITELLSGDQYPTQNYAVLFMSELKALLETAPQDSLEIKLLKENMKENFDHRFPLSELHVVSALLDPRFQGLFDVREYLKQNNVSAIDLLSKWIENRVEKNVGNSIQASCQSQSYIDELVQRHTILSSLRENLSTASRSESERECYLLLLLEGKLK